MRIIGHLPSEETANRFSDFLYTKGISNLVELDTEKWAVWIHSEDELEKAKEFFKSFLGNPNDPAFLRQARRAAAMRALEEAEAADQETSRPVQLDRRHLVDATRAPGLGRLTLTLVLFCIGVALLSKLGETPEAVSPLFISEVGGRHLPEVRSGQVWRLVTPIFLHFGVAHLIFNMLALVHLGGLIEGRLGMFRLGLMLLVLAVFSNVAQYFYGGAAFGGMSGVVFGLAGYAWIKGRYDPESGLYLHPQSMMMLMIWFCLCLFGVLGRIANVAHAVGLGGGLLWGYVSCVWAQRRRG